MKISLHGFMKAGLLDYGTKPREEWVGCHPGQVHIVYLLSAITAPTIIAQLFVAVHHLEINNA